MPFSMRLCAISGNQKQKESIFFMCIIFSLCLYVISSNHKKWEKYTIF
jgi:hypothetical protein